MLKFKNKVLKLINIFILFTIHEPDFCPSLSDFSSSVFFTWHVERISVLQLAAFTIQEPNLFLLLSFGALWEKFEFYKL